MWVCWAPQGKDFEGSDGQRPYGRHSIRKAVLRMLPKNKLRDVSDIVVAFLV